MNAFAVTVSPTLDDVFEDLRAYLLTIVGPGVEVIRGLGNRVSMPDAPFVVMTAVNSYRIETNQDTYLDGFPTSPGIAQSLQATKLCVQLDFYGPQSSSWAVMVGTLLRDDQACEALNVCQPLYADDPRMMPLVTAEDQFLERWTLQAYVQYNPVTTTALGFSTTLDIVPINVDEEFPP